MFGERVKKLLGEGRETGCLFGERVKKSLGEGRETGCLFGERVKKSLGEGKTPFPTPLLAIFSPFPQTDSLFTG